MTDSPGGRQETSSPFPIRHMSSLCSVHSTKRDDTTFPSGDSDCAAWLYRPAHIESDDSSPRPIVVMAHGLGGVKEMRLDAFAERFTRLVTSASSSTTDTSGPAAARPVSCSASAVNGRTGRLRSPTPAPSTVPTPSASLCGAPPLAADTPWQLQPMTRASPQRWRSAHSPRVCPPPWRSRL